MSKGLGAEDWASNKRSQTHRRNRPPTAAAIIASVATAAMVTSIGHHLTHHHTAEETHARAHCNIATRVWGERGGRVASFVVG